MPINVFGNSSNISEHKNDTSLFVKKPCFRSNYIEANIEENNDLKNQYKLKISPDPITIQDACSKNYVDNKFNESSILKNTAHKDLNDKNFTKARFIQVNEWPQIDSHLTAKLYVYDTLSNSVDESTSLRLDPIEKLKLVEHDSIVLKSTLTSPKTIMGIPTKA